MSDCSSLKADWEKLAAMASIFRSPSSFAYAVGKHLLVNGKDIIREVDDSIVQYNSSNWEKFGYDIGEAAAKVILGEESQTDLKVAKIIQGAMKPFGGHFNLEALLVCVYEEDQAALILDEAVKEMIAFYHSHDVNDLIPAVILTLGGLAQVKKGLPACEAIDNSMWNSKKFEQSFELMTKPTDHFEVVGNDVLVNGTGIKDDVIRAVEAYQAGKFEEFGEIMGEIAKLATEEKKVSVAQQMTKENIAEFMQGILKATGVGSFNLEALLVCVYEEDQAALILYEAVQLLEEAYAQKDIGEAIGGIIATVAAVQQARQGLPACESIDKSAMSWTKFDQIIATCEDPKDHMEVIGKDIVMNGRIITKDIGQALDSFRSGKFEEFGEKLGDALVKTTTLHSTDNKEQVAKFQQGFLKATGVGSFNLEALLVCVYEEDQAALILYEAVQLLEEAYAQKDPMEAIGGVIALVGAAQQARQGLPACESIDTDKANWSNVDQILSVLKAPKKNWNIIENDIVTNGQQIVADLETGLPAYEAKNYEKFGSTIGDIMMLMTMPTNESELFLF